MFVKFSFGYINLDRVSLVRIRQDGSVQLVVDDPGNNSFAMTADDTAVFLNAIKPLTAPTSEEKVTKRVADLIEAVAESYYKAGDRDQLHDFDAETDEPGEDEWPHWQEIRHLVRGITGLELLEMDRKMAAEDLAKWRAANCPPPEPKRTPNKFELPFGITVCRAPGRETAGSPYAATIVSDLRDELDVTVPAVTGAIEALESLILAHACEGIDIGAKSYVAGVLTAVESISNNYS